MSKPGKVLKGLCKKLGVRLTVKRGKKRVYKSIAVLKKQCANKKKRKIKKKVKRRRKFGSQSSQETQRQEAGNNNTHQPTVPDNFLDHYWQSYDSDSSAQVSGIGEESLNLYDNDSSAQSVQNFQIQQRYDGFEERQVSDDSSSEEEDLLDKDIGRHDKERKRKREIEKSSRSDPDGSGVVPDGASSSSKRYKKEMEKETVK